MHFKRTSEVICLWKYSTNSRIIEKPIQMKSFEKLNNTNYLKYDCSLLV